jgi:hypothetical protein
MVGPIVGLAAVEKRIISCPYRELNPGLPPCSILLTILSVTQIYRVE